MATNLISATVLSLELLLPVFNRFAERAGLDVSLPLNEIRVTKRHISSNPRPTGLMATFDGQHQFNWVSDGSAALKGRILYCDNKNSVSRLAGPKARDLTRRSSLISSNDARIIAERCLKNLGYDLSRIKAGPPRVVQYTFHEEQGELGSAILPAFLISWYPKNVETPHWSELLVEIEVSGLTKKVSMLTSFRAAEPATGVDLEKVAAGAREPVPPKGTRDKQPSPPRATRR